MHKGRVKLEIYANNEITFDNYTLYILSKFEILYYIGRRFIFVLNFLIIICIR